ncbi:hypothetical protein HY502_02230 [Candidatus Woesebacteria bacterium]|nr:hypothetical protein [Candidatus Woesebacteria bacterium]
MVRILSKAFLISAMCTVLVWIYTLTGGNAPVFAQQAVTRTPFSPLGTLTPTPELETGETILVRVSHYWPPLGDVNCSNFSKGKCISKMASGERWQEWVGKAIACPPELEFGTQILVGERIWVCLDRGGAIQIEDGAFWIDMLIKKPLYDYGKFVEATILPERFVLTGTE